MANSPIAHAAADVMQHLVEHSWHGYTQGGGRWGDGEGYCYIDTGVGQLKTEQGDRDCSSAVISAYAAAGVNTNGATYTGNMYSCFMATGQWAWHATSDGYNCDDGYIAQRGDIYLHHQNHTAMCAYPSPDTLYEFVGNEWGGITGGAVGDQTGGESITRGYYGFPWHGVLEFIGATPAPAPEPVKNWADIWTFEINGTPAQDWAVEHTDDGCVMLKNVASGWYLDVANANAVLRGDVWVCGGNGTDAQKWILEQMDNISMPSGIAPYLIRPKLNPSLCLDVAGGGDQSGTKIWLFDENRSPAQQWYIMDEGNGIWQIINNNHGRKRAMDVIEGGKPTSAKPVIN